MRFQDLNAATRYFANELVQQGGVDSTNAANKDRYKNSIGGELTQQFFTIEQPTRVVGTHQNHKGHKWWMYGEILSELLNLDPPIMYRYKPELFSKHYDLLADGRMQYEYGNRFVEFNQFVNLHNRLKENPNSKRAVIQIFTPYDTAPDRQDVPCTLGYNFLHRDGKLDMTVFMRSWDFFGGLKTYDPALSSFIQQSLCSWLDFKPGTLSFYANSLHYYNRDREQLEKLVQEAVQNPTLQSSELVLDGNLKIGEFYEQLRKVKESEDAAYHGAFEKAERLKGQLTSNLLIDMSDTFIKRNQKRSEHGS